MRPEAINLRALWEDFNNVLRHELATLFKMTYGEVCEKYSVLGLDRKLAAEREETAYGLLQNGTTIRLHILEKKPVVRALADLALIPGKTPHGRPRQNFPRGGLTMYGFLHGLPREAQDRVIDKVLAYDLDEVLRVNQRCMIGMKIVEHLLFAPGECTVDAMVGLADAVENSLKPRPPKKGTFAGSGSGVTYAPLWFAQYLAARGVWLLPVRFLARLFVFVPVHLKPLLPLLSVPPHARDIADSVIGSAPPEKTSLFSAPSIFSMAAMCSTMWSTRRFCPSALNHMKLVLGTVHSHNWSAINHIYRLLADLLEVDVRTRKEARFLSGEQSASTVVAFRWVSHPGQVKLTKISRLLGVTPQDITVPDHVKMLAHEMRGLLPTFKVQNMRGVREPLELFLIFALTLDPATAPRRLRDITRHEHVRSEPGGQKAFYDFLLDRCLAANAHSAASAMSKMQAIWKASALRDGFDRELPCPFDPLYDRLPSERGKKGQAGRALEQEVIDILIELNRQDEWAFARSLGWYGYTVRNPDGVYEFVFWHAVPLVLEITLRTGHRLRSVRWLDSGEGDERWYDPITMKERKNDLACAIAGRREFSLCFLRLDDPDRTSVNSMSLIVAKGGAYETAFCPPELIGPICELRDMQVRYNPIKEPVPAIDPRNMTPETDLGLFAKVFPLARLPNRLIRVVSDDMMRHYYKAFLRYAQPIVSTRLGRDIPLVDLERDLVLTTFHDHRRSFVTNSDEASIPTSVVRTHLGHASEQTTNLYNRVRHHRVHSLVQQATYNQDLIDRVATNDPAAMDEIIEQVVATSRKGSPQAARARQIAAGNVPAYLDLFLHGLCLGGDCSSGGALKGGVRLPVWRPRACGGCRFRGTGWAFRAGIVMRENLLKIELRASAAKSADLNRVIDKLESEGRPVQALKTLLHSEEVLRRNLTRELQTEQDTRRRVDAAAKAARHAGRAPSSVIVSNETFDLDQVETEECMVHEFEMLHAVMRDAVLIPAGLIELPPEIPLQIERQVRGILRANKLEDVFNKVPEHEKRDALVALGDIFLDAFGDVHEFQQVLEASVQGVSDDAVLKISQQIRRATRSLAVPSRQTGNRLLNQGGPI